jgi:tRNA dimethylallyltransferase
MKLDNKNLEEIQRLPVIVLTGPTGVGKTDLALKWARECPNLIEIISVDSAMIYRGMDIGTAKPESAILEEIPHHLVNIKDPAESYSVAQFCREATASIEDVYRRGKIPILVGGTMMYLNALRNGLAQIPEINSTIRKDLSDELNLKGLEFMYQKLCRLDLVSGSRLKSTDTQRILRALEIIEGTGIPIHEHWVNNQKICKNPLFFLAIPVEDRGILHQKIGLRTQKMLEQGLIEEVKNLYDRGDLSEDLPSIRSVGYRQVWEYFLERCSYNDLQENITISTRQLAKRQLTWLRSWGDIRWISRDLNLMELFSDLFK